jgi:heme-degrading monooxygenase HmoA
MFMTDQPGRAIARSWRGATRATDAEAYLDYLHRTGLKSYRGTPGNLGVVALRRIRDDKAEFLLISYWESVEAVRRFAGETIEQAVFYPEDDRFLVERDNHVDHYEVVFRDDGLAE